LERLPAGARIDGLLDTVVCHGVQHDRPDPEMALLAARLLDVSPVDCVFVGGAVDHVS
jgi:beta-phosphoglucomutase-like phosphatase (HAD superfamily)